MIIVTRKGVTQGELDHIRERVEAMGLRTHVSQGESRTIIGCIGDEERLQSIPFLALPGVEAVHEVMKPYKLASREFAADPTRIPLGGAEVGGEEFVVVAGPCSVEGYDMLLETAESVRDAGARGLRGGAFKPRTSPYSFQGLGEPGLELLARAREETGLAIVTEALDPSGVELVARYTDIIQIGARNMQNYSLLRAAGQAGKPIFLKRGMSATIRELLLAAEYLLVEGESRVMLCERGIRGFTDHSRYQLDLTAVPVIQDVSHLPVIVDPAHGTGDRQKVPAMARAAVAAARAMAGTFWRSPVPWAGSTITGRWEVSWITGTAVRSSW